MSSATRFVATDEDVVRGVEEKHTGVCAVVAELFDRGREVVQEVARAKRRPRKLTTVNGPSMPMFAEIGEDTGGFK